MACPVRKEEGPKEGDVSGKAREGSVSGRQAC